MTKYGLVVERPGADKNRMGVHTGYSGEGFFKGEPRYRLQTALESNDEHAIRRAQEEYNTCTEIFESKDERRI